MNIAIVGFDRDGQSTYEYFSKHPDADSAHRLTILDQNADKPAPAGADSVLGDNYLDNLDRFDLIVRTSGMNPQKILDKNPGVEAKITTQINEFIKRSPTQHIIGVTGTKGKGTASSLITAILEADGHKVRLGGNIGVPPLGFIDELAADDWAVLELSSFQLCDLQQAPAVAVCLMVESEHVDWHGSQEAYVAAKTRLFSCQHEGDLAVYFADNPTSTQIANASPGRKIPYFTKPGAVVDGDTISIDDQPICQTAEIQLLGIHNLQNVCAAVTAVWYGHQLAYGDGESNPPDLEAMRKAIIDFKGLPFRLRLRREVNGVRYYNDSFASAPPAPVAALEAISEPKIMIVGGYDRKLDLQPLVDGLKRHSGDIRKLVVIGQAGPRLTELLASNGFNNFMLISDPATTMDDVVQTATAQAQPGDAVVLSPGFASFDMFKDFEDRGRQFNQAIDNLPEEPQA